MGCGSSRHRVAMVALHYGTAVAALGCALPVDGCHRVVHAEGGGVPITKPPGDVWLPTYANGARRTMEWS